jgi:hypothetical protein
MGYARLFADGSDEATGSETNAGTPQNGILLLTTGSGVNVVIEPIYSNAVYGAGWYNAPETAHYADSALRYEGNIDFELQASTTLWNLLRDWVSEERAWPRSLEISPDGQSIYEYYVRTDAGFAQNYGSQTNTLADFNNFGAWATSFSANASEGSAVTSSLNVLAISRTIGTGGDIYIANRTGAILSTATDMASSNPLNPSQNNVDPIPYWKTNANLYIVNPATYNPLTPIPADTAVAQDGTETIDWSIDVQNNTTPLYTCNGTRFPTAVLQGVVAATGNVTLFNVNGVFDPIDPSAAVGNNYVGAPTAQNTTFRVKIATNQAQTTFVYLHLPAVVIESDDYGIKGQNEAITRGFSLKGLGGRVALSSIVYPPFYMSLAV